MIPVTSDRRQATLDGYIKFLQEKDLRLPKHRPCLVPE